MISAVLQIAAWSFVLSLFIGLPVLVIGAVCRGFRHKRP
jgi:hypothetical protein